MNHDEVIYHLGQCQLTVGMQVVSVVEAEVASWIAGGTANLSAKPSDYVSSG